MLRALVRDSAIYGASDFAFRLVAFAVFPVYAHALAVDEFGVLELLSVSVALLALVCNQGMNNAAGRWYWDPAVPPDHRPLVVSTGLLTIILASAAVTAVSLLAARVAEDALLTHTITWSLVTVALFSIAPAQVVAYLQDVLRLQFAPIKFTVVAAVRNLLAVACALVMLLAFDLGVLGILLGALIGPLLALPLAVALARRDLIFRASSRYAKEMLAFGHGFIYMGLAYWVLGSVDRWMLAGYADVTNVGWYSIAFKISSVITFLVVAFGQAWSPFAMRVYGEHQSPKTVYGDVLTAWAYLLALGAAAIALFASELLTILTPPEYWPAALSTAICASAAAVHGTTQVTALGISIAKRTRLLVLASGLAAAANVVLNVALIPRFGALGAALSSLAAYALLTGLYLYWTQKLYPIRLDVLKLLVSAAIVIVAPIAGALVDASGSQTVRIAAKAGFLALFLGAGAAVGIWNRGLLRQLTAAA